MNDNHIIHRIAADREYYVIQVRRALEVRARDTHTVLKVIEPPRDWGNNWQWSSCEFDGVRCVSVDCIRLRRTNHKGAPVEDRAAPAGDEQASCEPSESEDETASQESFGCAPRTSSRAGARSGFGEHQIEAAALSC